MFFLNPRFFVAAVAGMFLWSCNSPPIYYREGADVSRVDADFAACQVSALQQVPVDQRRRYIPPEYTYRTYCHAPGHCTTRRVLVRPGYFETYDANEGLRGDVANACMTGQGFDRVTLPLCSPAVIERTTITRTRVQPPITDESCIIRIRSGGYQIVNP